MQVSRAGAESDIDDILRTHEEVKGLYEMIFAMIKLKSMNKRRRTQKL